MNQTYTVKTGDTLFGISSQFGVSVKDLADLNNVNASTLKVGQELKIPTNTGVNPTNMFTYTVKRGDSLYAIANKYNVSVDDIVKMNNLKNANLSIGQKLTIPQNYTMESTMTLPDYVNYTVKKDDNIYSIAKQYNISVDTLMKDNSLTNTNLSVGQNLKIRINENIEVEECFGEDYMPPTSTGNLTYEVKKGDSLYDIANKYNTTVSELQKINNLDNINLSIGETLKVPNSVGSETLMFYTVKNGDNLYSIAQKYNTTVDNIKKKNNLTSNNLSLNQQLKI